jgi:uncharacterized protein (TIGR02598 family)
MKNTFFAPVCTVPPRLLKKGFSLVEVVLALGVVSFSSVIMIGLLGVGITSFQSSEQISVSSKIREQVVSDLIQEGWSGVLLQYFQINSATSTNPGAWVGATSYPQTYTFDEYGNLITGTTSTATSRFQATVTPNTTGGGPATSSSVIQFQIQISRVGVPTTVPSSVITYTAFVARN